MAKKKEQELDVPEFLKNMLEDAEGETGRAGVYTPSQHSKFYWGVPLKPICLQVLFGGVNIIPYGKPIELAGPTGSLKSSLAVEFIRMVCDAGGFGVYLDAEDKTSASMLPMILGYELAASPRVHHRINMESVGDWSKMANYYLDYMAKNDKDSRIPLALVVDSLTARMTDMEQKQFVEEGQAQATGFPRVAAELTKFFKGMPAKLRDDQDLLRPVVFIGINHLKQNLDGMGSHTPGGVGKDFAAAIRIYVRLEVRHSTDLQGATIASYMPHRLRERGIELLGTGSRRVINAKCVKSSMGPDRRPETGLDVPYYWAWDADRNQHAWFDWDTADCDFLAASRLPKDVVHVEKLTHGAGYNLYVAGKRIGDKMSAYDVCQHIEHDIEAADKLAWYFAVQRLRQHVGNAPASEVFADVI